MFEIMFENVQKRENVRNRKPEIRWNLRWFIRNNLKRTRKNSNLSKFSKKHELCSKISKIFENFEQAIWMLLGCLKFFGLFFLENEFLPKLFEQDEHVTDSETSRTSFRFPSIKVFWWLSDRSWDLFQEQLFDCHVEKTSFDNNVHRKPAKN